MNEVFPKLCSAPLGEAAAGSIVLIPHNDGLLLSLVTDESVQAHVRSIVILNLNQPSSPSVVFHENWGKSQICLCYETPLRFEISNKEDDIGTNSKWWRHVGVITSIRNEFFIRAAAPACNGFHDINVQTGAIFSGEKPNVYGVFGVWEIWLRDPLRERSAPIFNFNIHSQ